MILLCAASELFSLATLLRSCLFLLCLARWFAWTNKGIRAELGRRGAASGGLRIARVFNLAGLELANAAVDLLGIGFRRLRIGLGNIFGMATFVFLVLLQPILIGGFLLIGHLAGQQLLVQHFANILELHLVGHVSETWIGIAAVRFLGLPVFACFVRIATRIRFTFCF